MTRKFSKCIGLLATQVRFMYFYPLPDTKAFPNTLIQNQHLNFLIFWDSSHQTGRQSSLFACLFFDKTTLDTSVSGHLLFVLKTQQATNYFFDFSAIQEQFYLLELVKK